MTHMTHDRDEFLHYTADYANIHTSGIGNRNTSVSGVHDFVKGHVCNVSV